VPPPPGGAVHSAAARPHRRGPADVPELFEHDERGQLVVDERGEFVPRRVSRRELDLPDFHALRHTAAMDCDDAEEARDLLRHKKCDEGRLPGALLRPATLTAAGED
jgi:hypothetical protein